MSQVVARAWRRPKLPASSIRSGRSCARRPRRRSASEPAAAELHLRDDPATTTRSRSAVAHRVAARLDHPTLLGRPHRPDLRRGARGRSRLGDAFRADIVAVDRPRPGLHPRCIEPLLYFKGFHAIQTHRLAHWLWKQGRHDFALYLQSRSSEVFQTDIHPAARIGRGIFLDHATGLVVGATAVIEDNVSILQDVTLGGTGKERGDRHPKIRQRRADRRRRQDPRQYRGRATAPGSRPARWCSSRCRATPRSRACRPRWSAPPAAPSPPASWTSSWRDRTPLGLPLGRVARLTRARGKRRAPHSVKAKCGQDRDGESRAISAPDLREPCDSRRRTAEED